MLKLREWAQRHFLLWASVFLNVSVTVADILSSLPRVPGYGETNPYARTEEGGFILSHMLAYDIMWLVFMLVVGIVIYMGIRRFSELIAQVGFAAWFIHDSVGTFQAAHTNLWIYLHWYHPMPTLFF